MEIKIEKKEKSSVLIQGNFTAEEFETYYQKALEQLAKEIEMPGFRKGKVPKDMVEKQINEKAVVDEAASLAMNDAYIKAIKENKLDVIGEPDAKIIKIARNNPFEFTIETNVLPVIKLPDYKKILGKHKKNAVVVEDKEIQDSLNWLQQSLTKLYEKIGEAEDGNWVDVTIQINNEKENRDAFVLGKGGLVKEIEEAIKGMKQGESKEAEIKFKNDEVAKCKITLHDIKTVELPEINDDFAMMVGPYKGLEELKQNIHNDLLSNKNHQETEKVVGEALKEVAKEISIDIPEIIIERELQARLENLKKRVETDADMSFGEYLEKLKKTEKELLDSMRPSVIDQVKEYFILKEVQKIEEIAASDDEIQAEMMKIYNRYPDLEQSQNAVDQQRLIEYTKDRIESDKTFKKLEEYLAK